MISRPLHYCEQLETATVSKKRGMIHLLSGASLAVSKDGAATRAGEGVGNTGAARGFSPWSGDYDPACPAVA